MNHKIVTLTIFFIIAMFIPLSSFADAQQTPKASLSQLLQKVKQSKGDERRKAMNALKLKLRTVNAATRAKTMQQLRHAFSGAHVQTTPTGMPNTQQIPHQQIQQKMSQQQMMNTPHQNNPGIKNPPIQGPGMPSQPHIPSPPTGPAHPHVPSPGGRP